jgi:hypothetical protein
VPDLALVTVSVNVSVSWRCASSGALVSCLILLAQLGAPADAIARHIPPPRAPEPAPEPAPMDAARAAFQRLDAADRLLRSGRLGQAYAGYLGLLRDFPTWWLPMAKAGVAARAMGLAADTWRSFLGRAAGLSPEGPYLAFLGGLLALEGGAPAPATTVDSGPLDPRVALAHASGMARGGHDAEAVAEYGAILDRHPGCLAARWGLARTLRRAGHEEDARALLREGARSSLFPPRWRAAAQAGGGR